MIFANGKIIAGKLLGKGYLSSIDNQAPTAPELTAGNITSTSVLLSWMASDDNVGVTEYAIFQNGIEIDQVYSTFLTYSVTNLSPSTGYIFKVVARDAAGNQSIDSNLVSVTTPPFSGDTQPPSKPLNLSASGVSSSSVTLTWSPSTDNIGVAEYGIFQDNIEIGQWNSSPLLYNVAGLNSSSSYSFKVVARDAAGNQSVDSDIVTVSTTSGGDTQPPSDPVLSSSNLTTNSVDLSWTMSTDNIAVTEYAIFINGVEIAQVDDSIQNYPVTGLFSSTSYQFMVVARDAAGNQSLNPNVLSLTTLSGGVFTLPQANIYANIPMRPSERITIDNGVMASQVNDISGNGNNFVIGGGGASLDVFGLIYQNDQFLAHDSGTGNWNLHGSTGTFVLVTRYKNDSFARQLKFGGDQNSIVYEKFQAKFRNNVSGQTDYNLGYKNPNKPGWYTIHIAIIKSDGSMELHRHQCDPVGGWELATNNNDASGTILNRRFQKLSGAKDQIYAHFIAYSDAKQGTELQQLKDYLEQEYRSPYIAPVNWQSPANIIWQTNYSNFSDGHQPTNEEARENSALWGCSGGVRLDRSSFVTKTDQANVSKKAIKMDFSNTDGGWFKGQRFMNWDHALNAVVAQGAQEDLTIETWLLLEGLGMDSLGAKLLPICSFGSVPSPCSFTNPDEGYHAFMNRKLWNGTTDKCALHSYDYYNGKFTLCGQHNYFYNPDGSLLELGVNTWIKVAMRTKLNSFVNGVPQADGIFQSMVNGNIAQSNTNITMRSNSSTLINQITCEIFSGGSWPFNQAGSVYLSDTIIKVGF